MGRRGAFAWDDRTIGTLLGDARFLQGLLIGRLAALPERSLASLAEKTLADEVIASARIEGTELDADAVAAALGSWADDDAASDAGNADSGPDPAHAQADEAVAVALDATAGCFEALTPHRVAQWHETLFASGHAGSRRAQPGRYRAERFSEEPSERVMEEMGSYLRWLDEADDDLMLVGALAHLAGFLIRPFATGNGRIVRTLTELVLMRADALAAERLDDALGVALPGPLVGTLAALRCEASVPRRLPLRLYGLSPLILENLSAYKAEIVRARDRMRDAAADATEGAPVVCDVTDWVAWYLTMLTTALARAIARTSAASLSDAVLEPAPGDAPAAPRAASHPSAPDPSLDALSPRQQDALGCLLARVEEEGPQANRISTGAWARMCGVSTDTALRDITDLLHKGLLVKDDRRAGRSTSYRLAEGWFAGTFGV